MGNSWNDGHLDGIGESILGLSAIMLLLAALLWPLGIERQKRDITSGGCCKATSNEIIKQEKE
jgi:hypothetical protein